MSDTIVINITEPEDIIDVNIDQAVSGINIQNSDNSYSASASSSPFILPDSEYNVYVNGVFQSSFSLPTLAP